MSYNIFEYRGNSTIVTVVVNNSLWTPMVSGYLQRIKYDHEFPIFTEFKVCNVLNAECITPRFIIEKYILPQYNDNFRCTHDNRYTSLINISIAGNKVAAPNVTDKVQLETLAQYFYPIRSLIEDGFADYQWVQFNADCTNAMTIYVN